MRRYHLEENKEIIGEHLVEENTSEKTGKTYNKKAKNEFHEKKCKVIHYNRHTKTLDIQFDGYGIRLKDIQDFNGDVADVKYKGEIGRSDFSVKISES